MTNVQWIEIGRVDDVPRRGARVVQTPTCNIAIFRTMDNRFFALEDRCPHKNGQLSQGIVHDHKVTCPLHDLVIDLATGEGQAEGSGCAHVVDIHVEDGRISIDLSALRRQVA